VLGLFSLPDGGQPFDLRRERHSLVRLVQRIHAQGNAADVRGLQYGVTRERLRNMLEEADGWDIIHISDLLDLAHERARLVTVVACWSAATTANEQRMLLGIPLRDQNSDPERARQLSPATNSAPLATELASRLAARSWPYGTRWTTSSRLS
jgi:hypothetical protein